MSTNAYRHKRPHRRKRGAPLVSLLLLAALLPVLFLLLRSLNVYRKNRQFYEALNESVLLSEATPAAAQTQTPASTPALITGSVPWQDEPPAGNDGLSVSNRPTLRGVGLPFRGKSALPGAGEAALAQAGFTVDWRSLKKHNRHVKAWLYCADTNISYPVVQYKDNEYYLTHNFDSNEDDSGTLFFDCRNALSNGAENWIIYGHRRNDRSMFGSLVKFAERSYYKEHANMYLILEDRAYRVELFSCRTIHAEEKYFAVLFDGQADYESYLNKALSQSYWQPLNPPDTAGPILTLATCSTYAGDNEPRLLLHGRLILIGED